MDLKIFETSDPDIIAGVGRLRAEVWRDEEEISYLEYGDSDSWLDPIDASAYHWVVYDGSELVGAARLSVHDRISDAPYGHVFSVFGINIYGSLASINRLVVRKEYRGRGIAKILDRLRLQKARELGVRAVLALPVGASRAAALERQGYISLATNQPAEHYSLPLKNANVSVMVAPFVAEFRSQLQENITTKVLLDFDSIQILP